MSDFKYLKRLEVQDKTARFEIHNIPGEPVLIMKPATEANKPYFNAVLRKSRRNVRAMQSGALNAAMITENRTQDRELYSRFVIVGWENVVDADGELAEFTRDNCQGFIDALPDWLFDKIRNFAGDSANFTDDVPADIETLVKN